MTIQSRFLAISLVDVHTSMKLTGTQLSKGFRVIVQDPLVVIQVDDQILSLVSMGDRIEFHGVLH